MHVLEPLRQAEREFEIGEAGNRRAANELLRRAALILKIEKPSFAADELSTTTDVYLHLGSNKSIASYIQAGALLVERKVLGQAVKCFEKALQGMRKWNSGTSF